jgi:hypothetical protein
MITVYICKDGVDLSPLQREETNNVPKQRGIVGGDGLYGRSIQSVIFLFPPTTHQL